MSEISGRGGPEVNRAAEDVRGLEGTERDRPIDDPFRYGVEPADRSATVNGTSPQVTMENIRKETGKAWDLRSSLPPHAQEDEPWDQGAASAYSESWLARSNPWKDL